ncbi:Arginase, catabolizes arginine to ornithine and urea [Neophaeococcomyces mojaviensis]|uniref:Arginase, catabolizes arginine to ornithine and urea n=1 Tax=Neophaeococcomyces mojaviensis TaxID=3383035 RepID=A0ACC3A7Z2_9EURO|nr:Arginase, catabolizes arginine to ornithine and urea [Knufia sp. JES_112]
MPSTSTYTNGTNGHTDGHVVPTKQAPQSSLPPTSSVPQKFLSNPKELGITLVGFSGGQAKPGTDAGPTVLTDAGLLTQLSDDLGYTLRGDDTVRDFNNLSSERFKSNDPPVRGMKNPRSVSAVTEQISELVYTQAREGRLALTLGGDHSIAIGTVSGVARAIRERYPDREHNKIAVIWVDAHADINTPETSDSGNIHGMPVSFLTGLATSNEPGIFDWLRDEHRISIHKLVYIGLRDVDMGEKRILRENGIKAFSMHDIDRHGIGKVMDSALEYIGSETPIHLSFDVDALDPMWAPSTGTPVRGGLTLREGDFICEAVAETGQCVGVDLVEVNPQLVEGGVGDTVRAGVSLVRCALGDTLL